VSIDGSPTTEQRRDERWYLDDEREFLRRSLADADRERDAGDLSAEDHALLVGRDRARLAEVEDELAALDAAATTAAAATTTAAATNAAAAKTPEGRRRDEAARAERAPMALWRRLGIVVSCLLIALGAVILVVHDVRARQPGQASSGSVTVSQAQLIEQQLAQASTLNQKGSTKAALVLYDKVLSEDPSNPIALAYAGFLQWNVGSTAQVASLVRIGRAEIETAVKDSPSYYQAHLFYGLVLENQDHDHTAAVAQFNDFLADLPAGANAELAQAAPLVSGAYKSAGVALPAAFANATSTTATPSSAP
jgi:tetratricopeptide (TPR) repeat protein